MAERLEYWKLAPEGIEKLRELGHAVATATSLYPVLLEPALLELVRVLASRRNGCAKCTRVHEAELRKMNEPAERIAGVVEWRESNAYTQRERAALGWAEAVTDIQDAGLRETAKGAVREHFTDAEIANLTLAIATIGVWNRMEIGMGAFAEHEAAG